MESFYSSNFYVGWDYDCYVLQRDYNGEQSSLGPIDPQMGGIACQAVIDEFKRAVSEVSANQASLGLWQTIISKYHPTFLTACENAVAWSAQLAEQWLKKLIPR